MFSKPSQPDCSAIHRTGSSDVDLLSDTHATAKSIRFKTADMLQVKRYDQIHGSFYAKVTVAMPLRSILHVDHMLRCNSEFVQHVGMQRLQGSQRSHRQRGVLAR